MKKRFLAVLLTLCMVLSLLPVSAFAAEEEDLVVKVQETLTLEGNAEGTDHRWEVDDEDIATVEWEENNGSTATVTGLLPGTVIVTHTYTPMGMEPEEPTELEPSGDPSGDPSEGPSEPSSETGDETGEEDGASASESQVLGDCAERFLIIVEEAQASDPVMPLTEIPEETCSVDYKEQSEFVTYDGHTGNSIDGYIFDYTIHDGAPADLVIDLAQCALDLWENDSQMPGDHYKFQINIKNESGRTYTYRNNSFVLAPGDASEFGSLEEGSLLPILTYDGQYMPIRFSGAMIPKFFYKDIFNVKDDNDVTFEMMCNIYTYLTKEGYTGEYAISDYMLDYFNQAHSTKYTSLSEMFAEHPDWLRDDMTYKNGIWSMSEEELKACISEYPWIDRFLYVKQRGTDLDVQIKWPEPELAAISYNAFYQGLFSVVFGKENADYLNPNPSGDLAFSRSHAVGDYMSGTDLYEKTDAYFQELTKDGFPNGDTLEIWSGYGIDGPGMGNAYQNYSFTYYNVIELQEAEEKPDSEPEPPIYDFDVEIDKRATDLDDALQTDVTLNVGGNTVTTSSDVVFVLDKSASLDIRCEALNMLDELMDQASEGNTINVGVVNFEQGVLESLPLTPLTEATFDTIRKSMSFQDPKSSGTNIYAGLLAGKQMLDNDPDVAAGNKHLVLVSDGVTYLWGTGVEGDVYSIYSESISNGEENLYASHETIDWHHKDSKYYDDFQDIKVWYETNGSDIADDMKTYGLLYEAGQYTAKANNVEQHKGTDTDWSVIEKFKDENSYVPYEDQERTASAPDVALYMVADIWQDIVEEYNAYAYADSRYSKSGKYLWAYNAISNLGDFGDFSGAIPDSTADYDGMFDAVLSHVLYAIESGTISDMVGDYFDLTDKNNITISTFTLKVGGTTVPAADATGNTVSFGIPGTDGVYPYVVTYYPDGKGSDRREQFDWQINVPVETGAPIELTYSLTLVKQPVGTGTFELPTNEEATLEYTPSTGKTETEEFPIPEVEYTVGETITSQSLTVSKTVDGTEDKEIRAQEFDFTFTLPEGTYPYRYTTGEDTGKAGMISNGGMLQLQSGETVVIDDLPLGSSYTVSEAVTENFTTNFTKSDGAALAVLYSADAVSASGTIGRGASAVHFVNTYTPKAEDKVTIQPADITIYTGGSSYESVVNGSGNEIGATDNGLPVPGFYITLPSDLNERLIKHADPADVVTNENGQQVVDLSKYLTFTYNFGGEQRIWKLERYDNNPGNTSMAYGRYIYRILPAETPNGEVPIRLQFTDQDDPDSFMTSDDFTVQVNSVFRQYDMTIYAGDLEQQRVKAELTVGADTEQYSAAVGSGTLTIRGVTDLDTATTPVVNEPPTNEVNSITAHIPADAALYINESRLEVADPDAVHLLVDSIVPDQGNTLHNSAVDGFNSITEDHSAELRYLDLVDTSNGNAYVTTDGEITLYWPYPDGTDRNSEFQLVHYAGLDRNSNTDLEQGNYTMELYSTEDGTLVATDEGIRFTVDSFSPFALFWEDEDDDDDRDDDDDDDDDDDRGHGGSGGTPQLNKEDHFAYVSGYPDGTVQPNDPITREEVATIFFRLLTDASRADYITERNPFPDVESSRWSFYSITTLNNGGIMTGRTGGDFDPGAYITRAEFAVVAAQFSDARYSGPDKFSDISGHWAREYINRAAAEGWIAGYPDGTYGPDRSITRAEVMALINEVLDRAPDADHMLDDMIHWPDNPEDAWYYEDVQEATNCHTYRWSGSLERWIQITDMRTYADLVWDALRSAR